MNKKIFFILFVLLIDDINAFSISLLPDLEITNDINNDQKKEENKNGKEQLLVNKSDSIDLEVKNAKKIGIESNNIAFIEPETKIKDDSDYSDIENKNKLNNLKNKYKTDSGNIYNESTGSPILHFLISKVRPFIEVRIDSILIDQGFESYLHERTELTSKLKINTIDKADDKNVTKLLCGQGAELTFSVTDEYGNEIDKEYFDKKLWVNIGQNRLPRGLELGILGMKIGEVREIISPPELNISNSSLGKKLLSYGKNVIFKAKLHDLREDERLDEIQENLRFYDVAASISRKIACTDLVSLDLRILNASGEIIYTKPKNKNFNVMVGSGILPYLEQILLDAKINSKRISFIKTSFIEDLKKNPQLPGIASVLDKNEAVILELSPKFN